MTHHTGLRLVALFGLLAMLLIVTVVPGSSILDLNVGTSTKVLAFYATYMAWALLTALLLGSVFISRWTTHEQAKA